MFCRTWLTRLAAVPIAAMGAGDVAAAGLEPDVPLPGHYWQLPLQPQGDAPFDWSKLERSLDPPDCGQCHAREYEGWRLSRHAKTFSPGLVGQLLTMDEADIGACLNCHTPLPEQQSAFLREIGGQSASEKSALDPRYGNACPSCHLRGWQRYGPPTRAGLTGKSASPIHNGAVRSQEFEKSEFCSVCHQFPSSAAVNGKPLENTFVEWGQSRFAAEGRTCQSCHMPDRRHSWRGIHDPEMVESGLSSTVNVTTEDVRFTVANTGVGHAFPTYVAPRVTMWAVPLDREDRPLSSLAVHYTIQRQVEATSDGWIEHSDTRLAPGGTATLVLPWGGHDKAKVWLQVEPDSFYHREVYPAFLREAAANSEIRKLISIADQAAENSSFRLFETVTRRPQ